VLEAIADPRHKIVTLTISEVGYHLDARTGQLEIASPEIAMTGLRSNLVSSATSLLR